MQDYRKLNIWIEAMAYVEDVYTFSISMTRDERYGLTDQLKRAAVSIPLNIAEGAGCRTNPEFERFLWYAYRSVNETATCLELTKRLNVTRANGLALERLLDRSDKVSAMIYKFIQKLNGKRITENS
jgi:four helix bundle protein